METPMSHKIEKVGESYGLKFVVLGTGMGHRCGYVGIPESHPLFGHGYGKPHQALRLQKDESVGKRGILALVCRDKDEAERQGESPDCFFDVHGGITFSGNGEKGYPMESPNNLWWFGFDCGHCDDAPDPELMDEETRLLKEKYGHREHGEIRSLDYVVSECNNLARQLSTIQ
jgi:hypothetical protein